MGVGVLVENGDEAQWGSSFWDPGEGLFGREGPSTPRSQVLCAGRCPPRLACLGPSGQQGQPERHARPPRWRPCPDSQLPLLPTVRPPALAATPGESSAAGGAVPPVVPIVMTTQQTGDRAEGMKWFTSKLCCRGRPWLSVSRPTVPTSTACRQIPLPLGASGSGLHRESPSSQP